MTELERLQRYVEWNQATRHQLVVAHTTLIDAMSEKRLLINTYERALMIAQKSLRDAHEAAALSGVNVHWDVLEPALRSAHEIVTKTLSGEIK